MDLDDIEMKVTNIMSKYIEKQGVRKLANFYCLIMMLKYSYY